MAMREAFELKPAATAKAPRLARIHRAARLAAMPWLPVLHGEEEDIAWMTNVVLAQQDVWMAVRDNDVVGMIALAEDWVHHLYVDPACWRAGAGSALLDLAKQRRPDGFRLWTFQRNALARGFYRRHGLTEIRKTDGYDNEEKEPHVLLGWKLTS